jgi:putative hydrolase of the HAD superfamily
MSSRYAVGFDFDHTLGLDHQLERKIILEMLATYAHEHDTRYDVAAADASVDDVLTSYRVGSLTPEVAIAGFLEQHVTVHGAAIMDTVSQFRELVIGRAKEFITPIDGALEVLAALAEMNVPIAILTNGWSPFQEEKARLIHFSGPVLVSERIGFRKPAPEAFAVLAEHLACAPVDMFFVGDDPGADCAGATAAGMQSVWFDWENRTYPADISPPAHTIRSLSELLPLLQGRG